MRHKPSFRTSTRLPTSRHARAILQSNLGSLLLLTALLLYSNWCYQGLKKRVHAERAAALAKHHAAGPRSQQAPVLADDAAGFLFSWGLDAQYRLGRQSEAEADAATPQITLPQLEVAGIAASRHTLLVTRNGSVWSFGPNDSSGGGGHGSKALAASGQLGRGGWWAPAQVAGALQGLTFKQVAAGRYHSVAVTADGRVYTWGLNDFGQLGRAATAAPAAVADAPASQEGAAQQGAHLSKDERLPRRNRQLQAEVVQPGAAAQAAAGAASQPAGSGTPSSVADAQGSSASPSCHSGWSCHDSAPGLVQALANVTVVAAKAGRYSTVVLDAEGQLWLWGYDGCCSGQLPQQDEAWEPRQVQGQLQGQRVVAFDVGYTFWLAATDDGRLYTCDSQDDGYAGTLPQQRKPNNAGQLGRSGPPHQPGRVLGMLDHKSVVAVAAGREHAIVATADGEVFSFGGGQAVLGRQGSASEPGLVTGALAGKAVRHVAAGEYFSLAATDTMVYGWGSNAYLATGTGKGKDTEVQQPTAVAGPLGAGDWTIHAVAAGYQHALTIADQPGSDAAAKLRASALAAVAAGSRSSQAASVEVVLTEEQKQQQEQYNKEQQEKAAANQPANNSTQVQEQQQPDIPQTSDPANQAPLQPAAAAKLQAAPDSTSQAPVPAAAGAPAASGSLPADYHWSYLARQPAPGALRPHEVWAAWKPSPGHDALAALSPDVFKLLPKEYNTQHKNPCWGGTGPALACLPAFSIIGVSKCGTTDLYHRLTLYKQVILPATNKGPHFWDECPYPPQGPCQAGPSRDFQAYINLFSRAADLIRSRPDAITGEASSNTFTSANGIYLRGFRGATPVADWAGAAGANATLPALLREAQPYLRLILMLRDPVSRYYSAFHYYRWWLKEEKPPTPDDFHDTALKEVQEWRDCVAARSVPECVRSFKPQQLVKGMYAQFLPDWLRHWPRQQLLVLRYEDYIAALPQHLKAVLAFLGVPEPEDAGTLQAMAGAAVQNNKTYAPMRADTRALLQEFYAPFNAALAEALGNDERWKWLADE